MKKIWLSRKNSSVFFAICLFLLNFGGLTWAQSAFDPENGRIRFSIMHTSDFHSHLSEMGPDSMFAAKTGDHDP